jgi:hypothetical protein
VSQTVFIKLRIEKEKKLIGVCLNDFKLTIGQQNDCFRWNEEANL